MKTLFLSFTCEHIGVAMVTNMISQLQESFPFLIQFSKFSRQTELLRTLWNRLNIFIFSVHTPDSCSCRHSLLRRWALRCVLSRNFISIYIVNRTLHGRLGIRILSSRVESISHSFASLTRKRYFQQALEDKIRIPARPFNILYLQKLARW